MKIQRLAVALIAANIVLVLVVVFQARSTTAQSAPQVLRVSALEVVDDRSVVRARLSVKGGSNGSIELDLFDRTGIVRVKLGGDVDGSGLLLGEGGAGARGYVQIIARQTPTPDRPTTTSITLRTTDGRQRVIAP